jgi:thiamine transport system permease protein
VRGRTDRTWVAANLALMALWLGVPLLVLVSRSFRVGDHYGLAGWRALGGVDPASRLFVSPVESIVNSIRFAAVATLLAVVLGGLAATALVRSRGRIARSLDSVLLLPLGISAVTVGFGFLIALDEPVDLRASPWLIPIAQAVVALPFVVRTLTPVLRSIDPGLRDAAAMLGASPRRAWLVVDLPLVWRALLVAAGFAFAISLGEFGATVFLARPDNPTLPVAIFRFLGRPGESNVAQAYALAVVLMVVTATAILLVDRLGRRRTGWF